MLCAPRPADAETPRVESLGAVDGLDLTMPEMYGRLGASRPTGRMGQRGRRSRAVGGPGDRPTTSSMGGRERGKVRGECDVAYGVDEGLRGGA